jgi:dUTP pyrophosphatase
MSEFFGFINNIVNNTHHDKIMLLNIFIDSDDTELKKLYITGAQQHNHKIQEDPHFYDAGFDLYLPKTDCFDDTRFFETVNKVDFKVKCSAKIYYTSNTDKSYFTPFYTYVRSSMSKTPLRLANNQGIIDAGYRGNIIGMFDCILNENMSDFIMKKYSRILQICAPGLIPIYVNIVNSIEELGPSTSRGEGGIGSTGK